MKSKFDFSPGSSLYWPCDLIFRDPHLWVILTAPFNNPPKIVMVMLTTKRPNSDTTVELDKGDHPFITHPTIVSYMDANYFKVKELAKDIDLGIARPKEPFREPILKKIQRGLLRSKFTPKGIKNFCFSSFNFQPPQK